MDGESIYISYINLEGRKLVKKMQPASGAIAIIILIILVEFFSEFSSVDYHSLYARVE